MPMTRYEIRNVYSLADPELVKAADKDDPEALLEGVAMAGLVGVLRQLGDLAEFAAEIFHGLHEEVMATAVRGHSLLARVQQLESNIPSIEREFLSQTPHSDFFLNSGIDWHPNQQSQRNVITKGDLPRFMLDSYEECRGPPRLFLLDKFDVGGEGACLKRYSNPSVYKVDTSNEYETAAYQRDKRIRKTEDKGSRCKGGQTFDASHAKLHQLFLEERVQTGPTEPARRVKLKRKTHKSPLESESGESYVNKILNSPLDSENGESCIKKLSLDSGSGECRTKMQLKDTLEDKHVHDVPFNESSMVLTSDAINESSACVFSSMQKAVCEGSTDNHQKIETRDDAEEKQIVVDEEIKADAVQNSFSSDDVASETDNYMDALATIDSDTETNINQGTRSDAYKDQLQPQLSDSQSVEDFTKHLDNDVTKDTCNDVRNEPNVSSDIGSGPEIDQVAILEDVTLNKRDSNPLFLNHKENIFSHRRSEGHQVVHKGTFECTSEQSECFPTAVHGLSSFSFVRNLKGDVDNKHPNDTFIPMIPIPNILDPKRIDFAEKDHSTGSIVSNCSLPHAIISHVYEHPKGVHDAEVEPSKTSFTDDVPVAEENAENSDVYPLPELQIREMGDGVLHESDSVEETNSNNSEIEVVTCAVPDLAVKEETELDLSEIESVNFLSVPTNVDKNDVKDLEGDAELKKVDEDSINLEMEAVVLLPIDFEKHEDNGQSTTEDHSVINQLCIIQESIESGEQDEGNKLLVPSESCDDLNSVVNVPDNVDKYDGKDLEDDTVLKRIEEDSIISEIETSVVVLIPVDIDKNKGNGHSTLEDHSVINHLCIVQESTESGEHVEGNKHLASSDTCDDGCVLNNVDTIDSEDYEDGTQLKGVDEDTVKPEMETSVVVLLPGDVPNEDNGLSTFNSHSDIDQLCTFQESGEHVEGNKILVPSDVCDSLNNDVNSPSSNQRILQGDGHSFLSKTEEVVVHDMGSQAVDITPCDVSIAKWVDSTPTEADHNVESKCMADKIDQPNDQIDIIESLESSTLEGKVDQPNGQLLSVDVCKREDNGHTDINQFCTVQESDESDEHVESDKLLSPSDVCDNLNDDDDSTSSNPRILQGDSTSFLAETEQVVSHDLCSQPVHIIPCDFTSVKLTDNTSESTVFTEADHNLESKSLEDKIDRPNYQIDINEAVESSNQSTPESYSVPVSENPPTMELSQPDSHDIISLSDQVKRQSTPPFLGFGILPQIAPVKRVSKPPSPPLPPVQWRMKTPPKDGDQDFDDVVISSQMSSQVSSLRTEVHDNSSVSSESMAPQTDSCSIPTTCEGKVFSPSANTYSPPPVADKKPYNFPPMSPSTPNKAKFAGNLVLQAAVLTTSGQENISPSSNLYSSPSVTDEMPNNIRFMKIQQPRSPLIVDKTQLKKVSDGSMTQTPPKVEEHDSILDQIRAKSFKLKPAIQTRPTNIQSPRTNLRVAAILEKANAIRQAFAGSDDDDSDDWSD